MLIPHCIFLTCGTLPYSFAKLCATLSTSFAEELALKVNSTICFNSPVLFCACVVKKLVAKRANKINFFIFDWVN